MGLNTAEQAVIDRFNKATSAVAVKLKALNPDSPEFMADLNAIADGLDKMGQPDQPLPPTP